MQPSYEDNFVQDPLLFEHLLDLNWLQSTEARKEYFMSDNMINYTYGHGIGERTYTSKDFTEPVRRVLYKLNQSGSQYNVCFLNRYDNEKNQLGWHADNFKGADENHAIAVISLGAEREILWKKNDYKGIISNETKKLLKHNSLFVMPAGFQKDYLHRIPRNDKPCGIRISLTFRRFNDL